jgi:iron(III) transport system substrate-binding protein
MKDSPAKKKLIFIMMSILLFSILVSACSGGSQENNSNSSAPASTGQGQSQENTAQQGESQGPKTVAEVAMYDGPDRDQRLVEAAKAEGELNLYGSMAVEDMTPIIEAFQQKYGIKVNFWRAGSENVLQRIITEYQGNRFEVDIVDTNGPELEALYREQLFQEVNSPHIKDLIPEAVLPHKQWIATRLNVFTMAYNTNMVKKEDLPQKWEDLLDPKWKGMLGIEAEDIDWFGAVVTHLGEEKGLQLFRDIVATNGLSVRKGHTLLSNLVATGEVPLALTVYNYKPEQLKKEGAPIDWYAIEPAFVRPNGIGLLKNAPHPNAAVLFFDFMLSDAQEKMLDRDFVPTNKNIDTPLASMDIEFIDSSVVLDEYEKWANLWNEIIIQPNSN